MNGFRMAGASKLLIREARRTRSLSLLLQTSKHYSSQGTPRWLEEVLDRNSFGIAFDIDGVLIRGGEPLGRAPDALRRLYRDVKEAELEVPFVFLTNGGGMTEAAKAAELTHRLRIPVHPSQVLLGHTPFKFLAARYRLRRVLAVGKGSPATALTNYGFQKVVTSEMYAKEFDNIDPLQPYKPWVERHASSSNKLMPAHERQIAAVFVVSDPVDWGRELQVLCDVLTSGGLPGKINTKNPQPSLYFAADDFQYQAKFPIPRFGMGAFRIILETLYEKLTNHALQYTSFGKPKAIAYELAGQALHNVARTMCSQHPQEIFQRTHHNSPQLGANVSEADCFLKTMYMIGDNPETDIAGAIAIGRPWFSILVRTGCFQGGNHDLYPADKVVEDVHEALEFIAGKEGISLP